MVKLVMTLLVGLSITSWAFILQRIHCLQKIKQQDQDFQTYFSSGIDLDTLYQTIDQNPSTQTTLARIYHTGRNAFNPAQTHISLAHRLKNANRAMGITQRQAITQLETHLSFLATVGSTSPYIGLFGTVWGIMNAFSALGSVQTASIAMVAPASPKPSSPPP
jgi:biopolymer transport protein TolQ